MVLDLLEFVVSAALFVVVIAAALDEHREVRAERGMSPGGSLIHIFISILLYLAASYLVLWILSYILAVLQWVVDAALMYPLAWL